MKDLSFFDQAGVLVPGGVLLFGFLYFFPELRPFFVDKGVSVGGLGLFVLLAYAAGQALATIAAALFGAYWWVVGGQPSDRAANADSRILTQVQRAQIARKMKVRLKLQVADLADLAQSDWNGCFRLIYREVVSSQPAGRVYIFNGLYGLSRGLTASFLILSVLCFSLDLGAWKVGVGLIAMLVIFAIRTIHFGNLLVQEALLSFILLPDEAPHPTPAS